MPPKKEAKKPPSEDDTVRDARARPAAPAVPGCDASSARQDENRRKLWYAAEKGEAEVVSEFIAKGVKVNWKNPDAVRERPAAPPSAGGQRRRAPPTTRAVAASRLAQAGSTAHAGGARRHRSRPGAHRRGLRAQLIARNNSVPLPRFLGRALIPADVADVTLPTLCVPTLPAVLGPSPFPTALAPVFVSLRSSPRQATKLVLGMCFACGKFRLAPTTRCS